MQLSLDDIFLSDGMARAICWTLVHSLWQGVLVAVVAGLVIGCTRKLPAAFRYNLLAIDMGLFLLIAAATFIYELRYEGRPAAVAIVAETAMAADPIGGTTGETGHSREITSHYQQQVTVSLTRSNNFVQQAGNYLNAHASMVTLIWLACLSVQLLRLTGGLYHARLLRRKSVLPVGAEWNERLEVLGRRMGISRTVSLLQSGLVKAPSVVGLLKPTILFPLGMLSNIPYDQVEAILLHELAHIRRGDYLANLVAHLIATVFFFNPGVRWIALLIRQEREACCDDIVLAGTPDHNSYFDALVAFTQFSINGRLAGQRAIAGAYALQLGGGKTDLLWRVKRMLEKENKKLQLMEKALLSLGLLTVVSVCLISMKEKDRPTTKPGTTTPIQVLVNMQVGSMATVTVQVPAGPTIVDTPPHRQGQDIAGEGLFPGGDKVTTKTGQPIFKSGKLTFTSITSRTEEKQGQKKYYARAIDDSGNRYEIRKLNDEVTEFRVNRELVQKEDYDRYSNVMAAIEEERKVHPPAPPTAPTTGVAPVQSVDQAASVGANGPVGADGPVGKDGPAGKNGPVGKDGPIGWDGPAGTNDPSRQPSQHETAPTMDNPLVYTRHPDTFIVHIVTDLVVNRLVDHVDKLSFTLNSDQLIVNGTRQPEEIYAAFKAKYIKNPTDHFIYSQYYTPHGSGSHADVNRSGSASGSEKYPHPYTRSISI